MVEMRCDQVVGTGEKPTVHDVLEAAALVATGTSGKLGGYIKLVSKKKHI